jgi:hypothetical protein
MVRVRKKAKSIRRKNLNWHIFVIRRSSYLVLKRRLARFSGRKYLVMKKVRRFNKWRVLLLCSSCEAFRKHSWHITTVVKGFRFSYILFSRNMYIHKPYTFYRLPNRKQKKNANIFKNNIRS